MNLTDAKQFIDEHQTCVIATTSSDLQPEAATVGVSCDDQFQLLIGTNRSTRKAQNMLTNKRVALVIETEGPRTLQIDGEATEISDDSAHERIEAHFAKVPSAKQYAQEEGQTYFSITPKWLRFTDYTKTPNIFETKDFS